jgi:hypothetical protein
VWADVVNTNYIMPWDFYSLRATWTGYAAFEDGFNPFGDPLASAVLYDPEYAGASASRLVGTATFLAESVLLPAGATMETQAAAKAGGNWFTRNVFRWGTNSHGPHFHLGPGERVMNAHRILLPTFRGARNWWYHASAVVRRWIGGL